MSDITAEALGRFQDSLDRIEALLTGRCEPAPRLRIAGREQAEPQHETPLQPRLAEVIPIAAARK